MREAPSPNHDARRGAGVVDMVVLHYTGMASAEVALARLGDPAAKVSAHYLIDEAGAVTSLVAETRRAWHAGVSSWAGDRDVNSRSIGIELVNPGHYLGYRRFPEAQMRALERLAGQIVARHPIPSHRILGHADVAPARKADPGELFDWRRLAEAGIGLWPNTSTPRAWSIEAVLAGLGRLGYDVRETDPRAVLVAFQRHWRPARIDGLADRETVGRLAALLDLVAESA